MQKRAGKQQFNPDAVKDPDLRAYLQHLIASLDKQNQELRIQSQRNKVFEKYLQAASTQELIDTVAEVVRMPGSSLRIILQEKHSLGQSEVLKAASGELAQELGYLDEQILHQLGNENQLIIPDTTKIHSIKFMQEKKFPRTIAAFHFLRGDQSNGYLWLAYQANKDFTDFELELINAVLQSLAQVCEQSQKLSNLYDRSLAFERALELVDFPILIVNHQHEIRYANAAWKSLPKEQTQDICSANSIAQWLDTGESEIEAEVKFGSRIYRVKGIRIAAQEYRDSAVLFLLDETTFMRKQNYLLMAIDCIYHDFRSSLVNLRGFSKLLGMVGELNPKQNEYLALINNGVDEISTIVDDILKVSRLEEEGGLRISSSAPMEILEEAIAQVQADARQKRLAINLDSKSQEAVQVDKVFFLAALRMLLTNAIRSSHIGGTIYVEEEICQNEWIVSVRDEGKGISRVDIDKLKASHFQTEEWPGLSLVNRITKFHKGQINIESELGKGSKFIMRLPMTV